MSRARGLFALLFCALCAAPAHAAVGNRATWDVPQQRAVLKSGLLARLNDGRFHGDQPLTGRQLSDAFLQLGFRLGVPALNTPARFMSVSRFDSLLVHQLGLGDSAAAVQAEATRAGLAPPGYFGTEVVARLLGLRFNHPFPLGERIEVYPWDRITRAEAAWSLAVIDGFRGGEVEWTREQFATFALPDYTTAQRSVLRIAVARIGYPYVWGGESDGVSYGQVHGGYDCSGLVYKALGGRLPRMTAASYAGGIAKSQRVRWEDLRPADLMFFGTARFRSRATEASIVHTGIVLGNGWMINASSQGVYVQPMEGYRHDEFSWGRRVV